MSSPSKNLSTLTSFTDYCYDHPELRFWQALRNWAGVDYVLVSDKCPVFKDQQDTFYWTEKTK
jgi:hypothetical protein